MKKIILTMMMFLTTGCQAHSDEFRFEDYKSQEKFEAKIKEMFPVGGNFEELKKQIPEAEWQPHSKKENTYVYFYRKSVWWLVMTHDWVITITLEKNSTKIKNILTKYGKTHL